MFYSVTVAVIVEVDSKNEAAKRVLDSLQNTHGMDEASVQSVVPEPDWEPDDEDDEEERLRFAQKLLGLDDDSLPSFRVTY